MPFPYIISSISKNKELYVSVLCKVITDLPDG